MPSSSCTLTLRPPEPESALTARRNRPGDYLPHDADEVSGFKVRLNERLAPSGSQFSNDGNEGEWEIADTLAQWWRPNFETFMYPFIPAHVSRPKECKKLYFIQLPKSSMSHPSFNQAALASRSDSVTDMKLDRSTERAKEYEASGSSAIRALRQCTALRSTAVRYSASSITLQL